MLRPPDVLYRPTMLDYGRVPVGGVASRFTFLHDEYSENSILNTEYVHFQGQM